MKKINYKKYILLVITLVFSFFIANNDVWADNFGTIGKIEVEIGKEVTVSLPEGITDVDLVGEVGISYSFSGGNLIVKGEKVGVGQLLCNNGKLKFYIYNVEVVPISSSENNSDGEQVVKPIILKVGKKYSIEGDANAILNVNDPDGITEYNHDGGTVIIKGVKPGHATFGFSTSNILYEIDVKENSTEKEDEARTEEKNIELSLKEPTGVQIHIDSSYVCSQPNEYVSVRRSGMNIVTLAPKKETTSPVDVICSTAGLNDKKIYHVTVKAINKTITYPRDEGKNNKINNLPAIEFEEIEPGEYDSITGWCNKFFVKNTNIRTNVIGNYGTYLYTATENCSRNTSFEGKTFCISPDKSAPSGNNYNRVGSPDPFDDIEVVSTKPGSDAFVVAIMQRHYDEIISDQDAAFAFQIATKAAPC